MNARQHEKLVSLFRDDLDRAERDEAVLRSAVERLPVIEWLWTWRGQRWLLGVMVRRLGREAREAGTAALKKVVVMVRR